MKRKKDETNENEAQQTFLAHRRYLQKEKEEYTIRQILQDLSQKIERSPSISANVLKEFETNVDKIPPQFPELINEFHQKLKQFQDLFRSQVKHCLACGKTFDTIEQLEKHERTPTHQQCKN